MSTLSNLSSGLFGGLLGGLLAFGAAWFTIVKTRAADRKREEERESRLDEEKRIELAGKVAGAVRALESEVRWSPFLTGRTSAHLLETCIVFYASQKVSHPEVANWLLEQVQAHQASMVPWHRYWWIPFFGPQLLRPSAESLGQMSATIVLWAAGDIPDDAFSNPMSKPNDILSGVSDTEDLSSGIIPLKHSE